MRTSTTNDSDLLTPEQTAEILGVKPATLACWRCTKRYPLPYGNIGRMVRYRRSDVDRFIAERFNESRRGQDTGEI
ncbi:MAG: helix-turn-helix domain-containing protein [Krumholzibacteria bacterium]|nr:helix-turn-helix domain-containing protein [Candidatus Krumholzibacteria bacterium]